MFWVFYVFIVFVFENITLIFLKQGLVYDLMFFLVLNKVLFFGKGKKDWIKKMQQAEWRIQKSRCSLLSNAVLPR